MLRIWINMYLYNEIITKNKCKNECRVVIGKLKIIYIFAQNDNEFQVSSIIYIFRLLYIDCIENIILKWIYE